MATSTAPDTRRRILKHTLTLIGEHGIGAVSNRRVASAAGVALGSLTYHFPSQTQLLREALLLYVHDEVERLQQIASELRSSKPTAAEVAAEVQWIAETSSGRSEQVAELELHLHAWRDPELQDASARCFAAYEDLATVALEALAVPDPARHARTVVALMCGLGLRRLGTGERDADGTAEALLTIVRGASLPRSD
ncbi:MAG TPA: TetR family transcriptional regulator [Solirubrobacteraceae bacterium]|jgi:DNA-binding transcriptional regulator YbjK